MNQRMHMPIPIAQAWFTLIHHISLHGKHGTARAACFFPSYYKCEGEGILEDRGQ